PRGFRHSTRRGEVKTPPHPRGRSPLPHPGHPSRGNCAVAPRAGAVSSSLTLLPSPRGPDLARPAANPLPAGVPPMSLRTRREVLSDIGKGMFTAALGCSLAADLGLAPAWAADEPDRLTFGDL